MQIFDSTWLTVLKYRVDSGGHEIPEKTVGSTVGVRSSLLEELTYLRLGWSTARTTQMQQPHPGKRSQDGARN